MSTCRIENKADAKERSSQVVKKITISKVEALARNASG